jgi:hypothetical protein
LRAIALAFAAVSLLSCLHDPCGKVRRGSEQDLLQSRHPATQPEPGFPPGWKSFGASHTSRVSVSNRERNGPEIEISNVQPGAAGLRRLLPVIYQEWHVFSAEIRTDGVGEDGLGAQLRIATMHGALLPTPELHGTSGWRTIEIYYYPGRRDDLVSVACQLGGSKRRSVGKAYFRNLRMAHLRGAPPPTAARFNLDTLELDTATIKPPRSGGTWLGPFSLLSCCGIIAALGWRLLA